MDYLNTTNNSDNNNNNKRKSSESSIDISEVIIINSINLKKETANIMSSEIPAVVTTETVTVTMDCPATTVGAIIGKKGANVNEILKRSGCRVVVDQSDSRDSINKKVNLTGPPDKLTGAMQLVLLIIKDGANALFAPEFDENLATIKVPIHLTSETRCPTTKVGIIIGFKG